MGFFRDYDDDDDNNKEEDKPRCSPFLRTIRRKLGRVASSSDNEEVYHDAEPGENDDIDAFNGLPEDPEVILLRHLEEFDTLRDDLNDTRGSLSALLRDEPKLQLLWKKFQRAGGLSADDFRRFLKGKLRPRITRQRKHLRLISVRKTAPIKLIKGNGGEAA